MPKLKAKYKRKEDVPEGLVDYYEENDGEFVLVDVEGGAGEKVKDFRTQNINLRDQNTSMRTELTELRDQMKAIDGIDPLKYAKLLQQAEKMEEDQEKVLIQEGRIDEVVKRRTAASVASSERQVAQVQTTLKDAQSENTTLRNRLGELLIDQTATSSLDVTGAQLKPGAKADYLNRARQIWNINDAAEMVPLKKDPSTGKDIVVYGKDGNELKMEEWARDQVEAAPHLFKSSGGGEATGGKDQTKDRTKTIDGDDDAAFGRSLEDIASGKVTVTGFEE